MRNSSIIFLFVFLLCYSGCSSAPCGYDLQSFLENNDPLTLDYWNGWSVVKHPDYGYRWIEFKDEPNRIYITKKRGHVHVKYYSSGCWSSTSLSDFPIPGCDNRQVSDISFRARVEWLLDNGVLYLHGDSTSLRIQTETFAVQLIAQGDSLVWQDWNGTWSR